MIPSPERNDSECGIAPLLVALVWSGQFSTSHEAGRYEGKRNGRAEPEDAREEAVAAVAPRLAAVVCGCGVVRGECGVVCGLVAALCDPLGLDGADVGSRRPHRRR